MADGATATRKPRSDGSSKPKRQPPYGLIEGNYFQCWYPMALLRDLVPGKIIGRDFCGSRVVIYRAKNGKPVVQSAWCPHFGADLSLGEIHEGEIRCPYHHWRFSATGECSHIPTGDKIPKDCGVRTPTAPSPPPRNRCSNRSDPFFPVLPRSWMCRHGTPERGGTNSWGRSEER